MMLFPKGELLCDLYAIPAHNHQSYYALIYKEADMLKMVYAKPQIYRGYSSDSINMYYFKDAKKAECHPVNKGNIIIGIKSVTDELWLLIRDILENMPERYVLDEDGVFIDAMLQAIRMYKGNRVVKEIVYYDAGKIKLPGNKEYLRDQIGESLYTQIETLIK